MKYIINRNLPKFGRISLIGLLRMTTTTSVLLDVISCRLDVSKF